MIRKQLVQKLLNNFPCSSLQITSVELKIINKQVLYEQFHSDNTEYIENNNNELPPQQSLFPRMPFTITDLVLMTKELYIQIDEKQSEINLNNFVSLIFLQLTSATVTPVIDIKPEVSQHITKLYISVPLKASNIILQGHDWSNVTDLAVVSCGLSTIDSSFASLTNLQNLDLSDNKITKIQNLDKCVNLRSVNLSSNQIYSIEGINVLLGNIDSLNLNNNKLTTCSEITKLAGLTHLELADNLLSDVVDAASLNEMPLLTYYTIQGNPVCENQDLKVQQVVIKTMDNVEVDNNIDIDERLAQQQVRAINGFNVNNYNTVTKDKLVQVWNYVKQCAKNFDITYFNRKLAYNENMQKSLSKKQLLQLKNYYMYLIQIQKQVEYYLQHDYEFQNLEEKDKLQIIRQYMQVFLPSIFIQGNTISTRVSPAYPFGRAVPHCGFSELQVKDVVGSQLDFNQSGLNEYEKFKIYYQKLQDLTWNSSEQQEQIKRKHDIYPVQTVKQITFETEQQNMIQQDIISNITMRIMKGKQTLLNLLRDTGNAAVLDKSQGNLFLQQKISTFNNKQQELLQFMEQIGLQHIIPYDLYQKASCQMQQEIVQSFQEILKEYPIDFQLAEYYHYYINYLLQVNKENSDTLLIQREKQLTIEQQARKLAAQKEQAQLIEAFNKSERAQELQINKIIEYLIENKYIERKLDYYNNTQQQSGLQLIAVKQKTDEQKQVYHIYKYLNEQGEQIMIKKYDNEEGDGERIYDEESGDWDYDQMKNKQEEEKDANGDAVQKQIDENIYKKDPEQLTKTLQVCVPYGDKTVYVERRQLNINQTTGKLEELNDNGQVVEERDLRDLVTYIIADSGLVEKVYKCVVLLFKSDIKENNEQSEEQNQQQEEQEEIEEKSQQQPDIQQQDEYDPFAQADQQEEFNPFAVENQLDQNYNPFENQQGNQQDFNPFGSLNDAPQQSQISIENNVIPHQASINALPLLFPTTFIPAQLHIPLPGIPYATLDEYMQHTLNLQTDGSYDPIRTSHSFSNEAQLKWKKPSIRQVAVYYLSADQNASALSWYGELLQVLALPLMKAYEPHINQSDNQDLQIKQLNNQTGIKGTYWGYCLNCCKTFRACFITDQEQIQQQIKQQLQVDITKSNNHIQSTDWNYKSSTQYNDQDVQGHYLRKIKTCDNQDAIVLGYEENDYYKQTQSYVYKNDTNEQPQIIQNTPIVVCPHCLSGQRNFDIWDLCLDERRRIRAVENLTTGQEILNNDKNDEIKDLDTRIVQIEINDTIYDTVPYKLYQIQGQKQAEVEQECYKPDYWNKTANQFDEHILYWVIQRPADLPFGNNKDKYLSEVVDNVQRQIVSDALDQVDIPSPCKTYLAALGEATIDEQLWQNVPRDDQVGKGLETTTTTTEQDSSSENSDDQIQQENKQNIQLEDEEDEEMQFNFNFGIPSSLKQILQNVPESVGKQHERQILPFDITLYSQQQSAYYTQSKEIPIVYFTGYIEHTQQEFQLYQSQNQQNTFNALQFAQKKEFNMTLLQHLLFASEVDVKYFVCLERCYYKKQLSNEIIPILVCIFTDTIHFIFKRQTKKHQQQNYQQLSDEDLFNCNQSQFVRIVKPITVLEKASFTEDKTQIILNFSINQCNSVESKYVQSAKEYVNQTSFSSLIPDTKPSEADIILCDNQAGNEIIDALIYLQQENKMIDYSPQLQEQLQMQLDLIDNSLSKIDQNDEKKYLLSNIGTGVRTINICNQILVQCQDNNENNNIFEQLEETSIRLIDQIQYISVDKQQINKCVLHFNKSVNINQQNYVEDLELDFIDWRQRARFLEDIVEQGFNLGIMIGLQ